MKSFRALSVVVTFTVALCVFGVAPVFANSTHVFSASFGEAGSGDGQMELRSSENNSNSGVAVNNLTHDVYVADTGNNRVDEFSAAGVFIRAWGWGVADGSTEALQVCTSGCHAGLPGGGAGQFSEPASIAVDNSGGPSQGDVYVSSIGPASVSKFSASGTYLSSNTGLAATFPVAGPFGGIAGIAVDASGNLWVYGRGVSTGNGGGVMFEFAQDGAFVTDWFSGAIPIPLGIAIDSAGDIDMNGFVGFDRYTSSGALIGTIKEFRPYSGVAVDAGDNLFIDEGEQISRYAPSCDPAKGLCAPVESFGSGGELSGATRLAVDASNDALYAVNVGAGTIAVFGRTPEVSTGPPTNRTASTAMLSGIVSPGNTTVSDCHFGYVADSEYHAEEPDPYAAGGTIPCDVLPAGAGPVAVHAEVTGLTPGVAYHFRLQASNVYGTSFGGDETVPGTPPAVLSTTAANVTSASAELRATINPDGGDTAYHFEYGTTTAYGASVPVPDGNIGSGVGGRPVSRAIQGLLAGTVYHYRVLAHNPLGTTAGPDRTITTPQPGGTTGVDNCPNAAIRALQHASALPDCRAYEQVAPPNRDGAPILGGITEAQWQASADGSKIAYTSPGGFADAQTGGAVVFPYLSSRGQGGWSTHSLLPPQAGNYLAFPGIVGFSQDLSKDILKDGGGGEFGQDQPALVPGEPANNTNLFLRDNSTSSYQLIDVTPPGVKPATAELPRASSDLSHVVFTEVAALTPDAPPAEGHNLLYDWSGGVVHLVGVFPDGTPMPTTVRAEAPSAGFANHAVSADGSHIYFGTRGSDESLYLRQNDASTVQVDVAHGSGPGGHGRFAVASSDGSQAYFRDDGEWGLTSNTVAGSGLNLYHYDANSRAVVDLTPAAHAEVVGVLGASDDGSYVYFAANGVLAPGASSGDCSETFGGTAETCNLYVSHNGVTTFIAAIGGEDFSDWYISASPRQDSAMVSPDGRYLAFQSLNSLTGYDNHAVNGTECDNGRRCASEVFLYDAAAGPSGRLTCASCNPSGGVPAGRSLLGIPGEGIISNTLENTPSRYLSDRGRLFFNSRDALVSQDVNGQWDVYEYEPEGVGSCGLAQGCVALISSGTSPSASAFIDASLTGEDVFFLTSDRLVAQDGDQSPDLYDARVGGGFVAQNEAPVLACSGEACKPPASSQPAEQTPGSSGLTGAGNLTPSAPVSGHGKPVKKKHSVKKTRHRKKKKGRRVHGRRANHNRGGAK
jgi:hypothetical protein